VKNKYGKKVLIFDKYLTSSVGDISVEFDSNGDIINYNASTVPLSSNITEDPEVWSALKPHINTVFFCFIFGFWFYFWFCFYFYFIYFASFNNISTRRLKPI
jgi:hypothetical protein